MCVPSYMLPFFHYTCSLDTSKPNRKYYNILERWASSFQVIIRCCFFIAVVNLLSFKGAILLKDKREIF